MCHQYFDSPFVTFKYFLAIVIDGKTLEFALEKDLQKKFVRLAKQCRSVLCCRATPLQKGEVVKLIRDELNVMTLAIGWCLIIFFYFTSNFFLHFLPSAHFYFLEYSEVS